MDLSEGVLIAAIGAVSVIASAIVSYLTSRHVAGREIKKMKMTWKYEENRQYENNFSEMLTAVKAFCDIKTWGKHREAVEKINLCRIKTTGRVAELLNILYDELAVAGTRSPDWDKVQSLLEQVLDAYKSKK